MQIREPDKTHVSLDPSTCTVLEGHQHNPSGIEDLADSISTLGQLHPALIIEYEDGRRLIAAGRRRWMACKLRKLPLIANIWTCETEDINLDLFAKAIRVAENIERIDPSAMDIALQLQTIRNERQLRNASELASYMGMSEARVKKYLSVFSASDHLREAATSHSMSLKALLELNKCEKRLGAGSTKKLIARYVKGEVSTKELAQLRGKPTRAKSTKNTEVDFNAKLRKSGEAAIGTLSKVSPDSYAYVEDLISRLQQFLIEGKKTAPQK